MQTLVTYVPVFHEGYRRFFTSVEGKKELYIIGDEFIEETPVYRKDIRRLPAQTAKRTLEALELFEHVHILTKESAKRLNTKGRKLIFADDDASRTIAGDYFECATNIFKPVFLMWDKHNALEERPLVPDESLTHDEFHKRMLADAEDVSKLSSDIWRHVGAVVVRDGDVLLSAFNKYVPNEHTPYENGDPRNGFNKGIHLELSSALHAEAGLISESARLGVPLEGTDMYVTVFPCPPCAKLIAHAGIKNLYCGGGYSILDGEEVLKTAGVRILFVE